MLNKAKVSLVALVFTLGFAGAPALAQNQTGLVNIAIDDINVTVPIQAAVNIAANVCGVQLAALNLVLDQTQTVECTSGAKSGEQAQFTLVQSR